MQYVDKICMYIWALKSLIRPLNYVWVGLSCSSPSPQRKPSVLDGNRSTLEVWKSKISNMTWGIFNKLGNFNNIYKYPWYTIMFHFWLSIARLSQRASCNMEALKQISSSMQTKNISVKFSFIYQVRLHVVDAILLRFLLTQFQ